MAASDEARKIELEQRDLSQTITSLEAEARGLTARSRWLLEEVTNVERRIEEARPQERSARADYESLFSMKTEMERVEELLDQRVHHAFRNA